MAMIVVASVLGGFALGVFVATMLIGLTHYQPRSLW